MVFFRDSDGQITFEWVIFHVPYVNITTAQTNKNQERDDGPNVFKWKYEIQNMTLRYQHSLHKDVKCLSYTSSTIALTYFV